MWQTKYAAAIPKNLGVGVNFRPCSEGYFLSGRPQSVTRDIGCIFFPNIFFLMICYIYTKTNKIVVKEGQGLALRLHGRKLLLKSKYSSSQEMRRVVVRLFFAISATVLANMAVEGCSKRTPHLERGSTISMDLVISL